MSGLPYQGGMNSYMFDTSQYGVNMPDNTSQALNAGGKLSSMIPFIGPVLGAMFNFWSTQYQNQKQEEFYEKYMSPGSRMRQMIEAGINPNAAAQGISGAAPPQMNAAAPSSAFSAFGEQLGNSANNALTANLIKSQTREHDANADLTNSMNTEQTIKNKYVDAEHVAALDKLVSEGHIAESTANIIKVDEYYKGSEAAAHLEQSWLSVEKMGLECENLYQEYFNLLAEEYATYMAGNLSSAQINKVFSDIGLNNAMINEISHRIDNIDASTMAITQDISESKARERLTRVQAQYQEKVLGIWNKTGWNENSDVNSNFQRLCMEGKIDEASTLLKGTKAMIYQQGEARFGSKDYMFDKSMDMIGNMTRIVGFGMIGSSLRPIQGISETTYAYDKAGRVTLRSTQNYSNIPAK